MELTELLNAFTTESRNILGDYLTGIYLHGSAAMGCFNAQKSDVDLLVVIKKDLPRDIKRRYMDMVITLNREAPPKGIEFSMVTEAVCSPFLYPTPFTLHFSITHLNWYLSDPEDYIDRMNGTDRDLAAHFTILSHRGKTLYGRDIKSVFSEVSSESYLDSIWFDIQNATKDILENPMYIILNLCRVLAYQKERLILSKKEGAEWAASYLTDPEYQAIVKAALHAYTTEAAMSINQAASVKFAEYMLQCIRGCQRINAVNRFHLFN